MLSESGLTESGMKKTVRAADDGSPRRCTKDSHGSIRRPLLRSITANRLRRDHRRLPHHPRSHTHASWCRPVWCRPLLMVWTTPRGAGLHPITFFDFAVDISACMQAIRLVVISWPQLRRTCANHIRPRRYQVALSPNTYF